MIKVFIWNYRGSDVAWGHASMKVGKYYISYWPENENQNRFAEDGPLSSIYCAPPISDRSYKDDVRDEKGGPNHTIYINGLNEENIIKWWKSFSPWANPKKRKPIVEPWCSLGWNCSKVVSTALRKGGGDEYSNSFTSSNLVWKPDDVLSYARSIRSGIKLRKYLMNNYPRHPSQHIPFPRGRF